MVKKSKDLHESIKTKKDPITWIVFLFSISIVLISSIPVIFPAAIVVSSTLEIPGIEPETPDFFETGPLSGGMIAANLMVFGLAFLYFKGKLPNTIASAFRSLFNFEISKKVALIVIVILLVIYVGSSASELGTEEKWEDYKGVKEKLDSWSFDKITTTVEPQVKFFLTWLSMGIFGSYKVIPFLASIGLLISVYFITKTVSQKRFAGIIAMIILMQSNVFLTFDTSVAYTNFWILFYLLSLYFVVRKWPLSPVFYILSIPSKYLTAAFLPMSLFFVFRSNIPTKRKMIVIGSLVGTILIILIVVSALNFDVFGISGSEGFSSDEFWMGFTSYAIQLRYDGLTVLFMIPLMVGLFLLSRSGMKNGESIMVLISGMLLIAPILTGFTNQTNQPYRFVPLITFFAIGVGTLLSKRQA